MIIQDWPEEWRVPDTKDQISAEGELQQDDPLEKHNGNQGGDPPTEIPRSSPYNSQNESSVTPTDIELGDKIKR